MSVPTTSIPTSGIAQSASRLIPPNGKNTISAGNSSGLVRPKTSGVSSSREFNDNHGRSILPNSQAYSPPYQGNGGGGTIAQQSTMSGRRRIGMPSFGSSSTTTSTAAEVNGGIPATSSGGNPSIPAVRRIQRTSTMSSRRSSSIPNANSSGSNISRLSPPVSSSSGGTLARRGGAGAAISNISASRATELLQRSGKYDNCGDGNGYSDDEDLERVVRQGTSSGSGLVNAYGVGTRAGNVRKSTRGGRQSLASSATLSKMSGGGISSKYSQQSRSPVNNSRSVSSPPSDLNDRIRVCVRKRPLSKSEVERGEKDITAINGRRGIIVNEPKLKVDMTKYIEEHHYNFNEVFSEGVSNQNVYKRTAAPLVDYFFSGGKATCFAYGQTGSGKTYTMLDTENGLYIQAAKDIFEYLARDDYAHLRIYVTFYEIYLTSLFDLLNNRKKLFAREDGNQNVVIQGIREVLVDNVEDLMAVFEYGNNARSVGSTGANADSSRSHAILQILLKDSTQRRPTVHGKLSFIDLAGNERGADRGDNSSKQTRMEGAEINKSLLALKECIRALDLGKKHQPFRQSKLTQVLKDSFIGNSRACMIATVSPNISNCEHTLNTLRYADRVKAMKGSSGGAGAIPADGGSPGYAADAIAEEEEFPQEAYEDAEAYYEDEEVAYEQEVSHTESAYPAPDEPTSLHGSEIDELDYTDSNDEQRQHYMRGQYTDVSSHNTHKQLRQQLPHRRVVNSNPSPTSILDEQPNFLVNPEESEGSNIDSHSPSQASYGTGDSFSEDYSSNPRAGGNQRITRSMAHSGQQKRLNSKTDVTGASGYGGSRPPPYPSSTVNTPPIRPADRYGNTKTAGHAHSRTSSVARSQVASPTDYKDECASKSSRYDGNHKRQSSKQSFRQGTGSSAASSPHLDGSSASSPNAPGASTYQDQHHQKPSASSSTKPEEETSANDLVFDLSAMDAFVKLHRAEIRATTESCKEETRLISNYTSMNPTQLLSQAMTSLSLQNSNNPNANNNNNASGSSSLLDRYKVDPETGKVERMADNLVFDNAEAAKLHEAMEYLEKLDEVLAKKQEVVHQLRCKIRGIIWGDEEPGATM
ncbi:hypothetical protein H4219_005132 [Mycoemilia scoparia]|uniref:Kinesin motor domain-containing protein n=1 Tax=Mycoemilia scoparia TaxID=417184 RepID=A0A9W7ZV33_9FUNG|nr:hypothetical protein H4219_005132 [Mycoemilia scoparia]